MTQHSSALSEYRLLGRSGLRVSPLSLGTMTFGAPWGCDEPEAKRIFDAYVGAGGNFIDTANYYGRGASEQMLGRFAAERREQLVLATKYSLALDPGNPNACGNHRRNMVRSVEDSLRRLSTDYIDLFYLHMWDATTPVDEIMRAFDDLVRSGKVVYIGISDTPAWQVARMQMLAELRGWTPFAALQIEYSLLQRTVERDLIPMAAELGLGVMPWSPIGGGRLSGKYRDASGTAGGRAEALTQAGLITPTVLEIADTVRRVATRHKRSAAEIALAWTLLNPAITAPIIGARTLDQLQQNLGVLDLRLSAEDIVELEQVSRIDLGFPHDFLKTPHSVAALAAGTRVAARGRA
ncbi:aldo/keto reductase [Sphingobium sp. Sx8-8]|uniref:aldo/keto reductase n=1 Tax=Sphingobium sp. Sx8-8 TaxID=2933617 RepID=UPI001F574FBC|nr:aldo/keto reductase [Sphingobium sp. Sx8-8]